MTSQNPTWTTWEEAFSLLEARGLGDDAVSSCRRLMADAFHDKDRLYRAAELFRTIAERNSAKSRNDANAALASRALRKERWRLQEKRLDDQARVRALENRRRNAAKNKELATAKEERKRLLLSRYNWMRDLGFSEKECADQAARDQRIKILTAYKYGKAAGVTYRSLGKQLGLSSERVRQIVAKAERMMKRDQPWEGPLGDAMEPIALTDLLGHIMVANHKGLMAVFPNLAPLLHADPS